MESHTEDRLSSVIGVSFSSSVAAANDSINRRVMEQCVLQLANLDNEMATLLRDRGDIAGARRLLESNVDFLKLNADKLESPILLQRSMDNQIQARQVDSSTDWKRNRKIMRALQYSEATQQVAPAQQPPREP